MASALLASLVAASVLASCGGEDEVAANAAYSDEAEALLPQAEDFGPAATSSDRPRPGLLFICDIDSLFWARVKNHAATPLIRDRDGSYVVLVGVFRKPAAASAAYESLLGVGSRRCYSEVAETEFSERIGYRPITERLTSVTREKGGGSEGTAVTATMQMDLEGGTVPSFSTVGVIRRGRNLYLIHQFGRGRAPAHPLPSYDRILRPPEPPAADAAYGS